MRMKNLATLETNNAITTPNTYKPIITNPCKLSSPNKYFSGITSPVKIAYTGSRAEQLMSGVTRMVSNRSFRFSMLRALMMAGPAQANPLISGITLFPFNPTLRISRSVKKLMRAM